MVSKLRTILDVASIALAMSAFSCAKNEAAAPDAATSTAPAQSAQDAVPPPVLREPVDLYRDGQRVRKIDAQGAEAHAYVFLDLGEAWTPILFTDGEDGKGQPAPHAFRPTYLALARGEFPDDAYGERAKSDKYLELYGILPTLGALRTRLTRARDLACARDLDRAPLDAFTGVVSYQGPEEAVRAYKAYVAAERMVSTLMAAQGVHDVSEMDTVAFSDKQRAQLALFLDQRDDHAAIRAAQARLACEGYFKGRGRWLEGAFDWATHEALAEFERRHRIYSWGTLGPSTVAALRIDGAQLEHEAVLRVLTERAMHALGAVEDGSARAPDGSPATYRGADGQLHEVPNLEAELRRAIVQAFGLTDPEATHAFLASLGTLPPDAHHYVAFTGPMRPEYHARDMALSVGIDRGDLWYEFPFDELGKERPQPVSRRPHTTLYVSYLGQRIPLASLGTTIGGWKSELIDGSVWWKYKESPAGEVLWREIVSAPVWLPPDSTPPRDLLRRRERPKPGEPKWEVNYHETGPSYASAYGLVAAYHRPYVRASDGTLRITGDDGIRSHGSVDYMSIMRRHSHGCHRLHNHLAVRLFSFVVAHRAHVRSGHQPLAFVMDLEYDGEPHHIELKRGGYVFRLSEPIFVTVEEGRVRGKLEQPIELAIPKFNATCKAYYLPDGRTVVPTADGKLLATRPPKNCDPGLPPLPPPPAAERASVERPDGDPNLVSAQPAAQTLPGEKLGPMTP